MKTLIGMGSGIWLGRVFRPRIGPCIVTLRDNQVIDITTRQAPFVRDILEMDDPVSYLCDAAGERIGTLEEITANNGSEDSPYWLSPCDLQAIKACGVTFARSMVERVIEERSAGDPNKADCIRSQIGAIIGDSLDQIEAGSEKAMRVREELIAMGLWSQYLEVGIGPDAEIFSKAQTLSSVGTGAAVGLHPMSHWNNPEPEIVLAVSSAGRILGATLGNDVNLRDVEGRSALLLSKAKDNNASCAIGPMIRLFDGNFTLETVRQSTVHLRVEGPEGYVLESYSSMREISRDPEELVAQTIGRHHQYPDGFMLFLGTMFAPSKDRDAPGQGFTHKIGDRVLISCDTLGVLENFVQLSTECPEWTFGLRALISNLVKRDLL